MIEQGKSGGWLNFTATSHLVSGDISTRLEDAISWTSGHGTAITGRVPVEASAGSWERLHLAFRVSPLRPSEFSISYVARLGWIRRLCVNREHRPYTGTHKHRILKDTEDAYEPDDIPAVPLDAMVATGVYEQTFLAFIAECNIEVRPGFRWSPPWEGM